MSANTFGTLFKWTTFGESHGPSLGVVIDGCPSGIRWQSEILNKELERRRPGSKSLATENLVSSRNETDVPQVLSGVFENLTLGTPIAIAIQNQDQKSSDYDAIKNSPRAGHADDTWKIKFGHTDHRGGGRSSGRETVSRVLAGSVARMAISQLQPQIKIRAWSQQIGSFELTDVEKNKFLSSTSTCDDFQARFPGTPERQNLVHDLLVKAREQGESYGGQIGVLVQNVPAGLGQPVFHKLKADIAAACMSVGATTGFLWGDSQKSQNTAGTEFHSSQSETDVYGGLRGGITTGEDLFFQVLMKPTSSILDVAKKGRHDPCIVIRAIPVIEAMVATVLVDHLLWRRLDQV